MCTLIVLHRCSAAAPLLVAANRDEYLDRASDGPGMLLEGRLPVVAPRDLQAGGTWLGVNSEGLFAAITNRPSPRLDARRRSRGLLVLDALEASSAAEAAGALGALASGAYNPFNLLVADGKRAFVVVYEGAPELRELAPGPHVIGNADPDDGSHPKTARQLAEVEQVAELPPDEVLDGLAALCRAHDGQGSVLEDTCIHAGAYGTRSSTLLQLGDAERTAWRFADGPPCRVPYQDITNLLHPFGRGGHRGAEEAIARMGV